MKRLITSLLLLLACVSNLLSQYGYIEKKNYVSVQTGLNVPLLAGTFNESNYGHKGDGMKSHRDYIDFGASVELMRNVDERISVGLVGVGKQYSAKQTDLVVTIYDDNAGFVAKDTTWVRMDRPAFRTFTLLPKVEIFRKMGNGPIGIFHELGLGFSLTSLVNRGYNFSLNPSNPSDQSMWSSRDQFIVNYDRKPFKSFLLLYGVGLRLPLKDYLSLNVGVRYSMSVYLRPDNVKFNSNKTELFDYADLFFKAQRANLCVIQFLSGLTFHF